MKTRGSFLLALAGTMPVFLVGFGGVARGQLLDYPVTQSLYIPGSYAGRTFYYDHVHLGEDVALSEGTAIRAIGDGRIVQYEYHSGYATSNDGTSIAAVIEHDLGTSVTLNLTVGNKKTVTASKVCSIYGHIRKSSTYYGSRLGWNVGDTIHKGDIIGYTNDGTHNGDGGVHLHLGIRLGAHPGRWVYYGYESSSIPDSSVSNFAAASEVIPAVSCGNGSSVTYRNPITGGPPVHPTGTFIKTASSGSVYVIRGADAHRSDLHRDGIASPDVLYNPYNQYSGGRQFDFKDVITVADDEMALYPIGGTISTPYSLPSNGRARPDGTLVGSPGGEVSIVTTNGGRRPFNSATTFTGMGCLFCNVVSVSQAEYDSYTPVGAIVDGTASGSDTTAPTITITSPTSNPTYSTTSNTISLAGTASDNVGVAQVTWSNNRGGSGTASGTASWSVSGIGLQSGQNVITVTARDAAGNQGTASITVTYSVADTVPPSITITSPTSSSTFSTASGTINLAGTASDNVAVAQVTWSNNRGGSGTATGTMNWTINAIALQAGLNVITVTALDTSGNSGTATISVTFTAAGDPDVTSLTSQTRPVGWYFFTGPSGRWYIANASANVMALEAPPSFPAGPTLPWKPISNYSIAYAGYPAAPVNYSYAQVSADGRSVSFGSLIGGGSDVEVAQLANTTQPVKWVYFQDARGIWYIFDPFSGWQSVMRLMGYDPTLNVLWKPIHHYPSFAGYPAADYVYQSVVASSDGRSIIFGPLK